MKEMLKSKCMEGKCVKFQESLNEEMEIKCLKMKRRNGY